jgi:ketosteroid isomerase-like protein
MISLPKPQRVDSPNAALVERFCNALYWEEAYADLFAPDVVVDFPHAPPGMLQHLDSFEFGAFCYWLRNTVRELHLVEEPTIIPTTDPNVFWAVRFTQGKVYWALRECDYANEHAMLIRIKEGKISYVKDYFNPLAFYRALNIELPAFRYDPDPVADNTRMPEGAVSALSEEVNRQRVIDNFTNPINFDSSLEPIYASDILMVCPNVPYSMLEGYSGVDFDIENQWMFQTCVDMVDPDVVPSYQSPDGKWLMVEANCYLRTLWSGHEGHYTQRELYIVYLENGKIKHFRVYFNPINKFSSMNQSVPSFPYFNF